MRNVSDPLRFINIFLVFHSCHQIIESLLNIDRDKYWLDFFDPSQIEVEFTLMEPHRIIRNKWRVWALILTVVAVAPSMTKNEYRSSDWNGLAIILLWGGLAYLLIAVNHLCVDLDDFYCPL